MMTMIKPFFLFQRRALLGILLTATALFLKTSRTVSLVFSPDAASTFRRPQSPIRRYRRSRFSNAAQYDVTAVHVFASHAGSQEDEDEEEEGESVNGGIDDASRKRLRPPDSKQQQPQQKQQTHKTIRIRHHHHHHRTSKSHLQPDSVEALEKDVQKVLKEMQSFQYDPEIPAWFRLKKLSFTNYWGLEEWDLHSSRKRFQRYILKFPKSRLLRRLFPQLSVLMTWSTVAVLISHFRPGVFTKLQVPLTSLSLVSTFVAALQTLRSDKGLNRLSEGRLAMARMVLYTRDTALLMTNYIAHHDLRLGLKAARHLALFGWSLKFHLRGTTDDDSEMVIRTLLGDADPTDAAYVLGERKKPIAILNRLRQIMANMSHRQLISTTEHRLIEDNIRSLDDVITVGERIRSTPIPPVYAGHSTRLMMLYLTFLPLALLGANMNGLSTICVTMIVGYAMLGLDEMSHMFEQPFRFMPLHQLARVSTLDVADAFCRPPPPLFPAPIPVLQQEREQQQQQQQQSATSSRNDKSSSELSSLSTPTSDLTQQLHVESSSSSEWSPKPRSSARSNSSNTSESTGISDGSKTRRRPSYWADPEESASSSSFPPLPYDGRKVKKHLAP